MGVAVCLQCLFTSDQSYKPQDKYIRLGLGSSAGSHLTEAFTVCGMHIECTC